jgi:translation initiation factor eIF-2B subunit epsilon
MSKNKKISDIDEAKREQKLQAVLLADSFSKSFRPMTLQSPKVLLPLVNVPMIEYTVEFLARNGVGEVRYPI